MESTARIQYPQGFSADDKQVAIEITQAHIRMAYPYTGIEVQPDETGITLRLLRDEDETETLRTIAAKLERQLQ